MSQPIGSTESFSPSVMIDGHSVAVPGILWVVAFALRGIPWALEEIKKPEVDAAFKKFLLEQRVDRRQDYIDRLTRELAQAQQLQDEDHAYVDALATKVESLRDSG